MSEQQGLEYKFRNTFSLVYYFYFNLVHSRMALLTIQHSLLFSTALHYSDVLVWSKY